MIRTLRTARNSEPAYSPNNAKDVDDDDDNENVKDVVQRKKILSGSAMTNSP